MNDTKNLEGYDQSPPNITSDEAYVDVSHLDTDQSLAFQDSMAKIRRNKQTQPMRVDDHGTSTRHMC